MLRTIGLASVLACSACVIPAAPAPSPEQGGANVNDRTFGGDPGQELLTGAMTVSPDGAYAVMQRNTTSVLFDVKNKRYAVLDFRVVRAAWSKVSSLAVFTDSTNAALGFDLEKQVVVWRDANTSAPSLVRVSDDGASVLVASGIAVNVLETKTGRAIGGSVLGTAAAFAAEIPGKNAMLVVGTTSWSAHKPSTPVLRVDLTKGESARADVPNCSAPIEVLADASRALMSPTFCDEGVASTASGETWTNPDPVSVIDLDQGVRFKKNLPGFGPVALRDDGSLAVAYLDMQRIDRSMFDDPAQIPGAGAPQYHLMMIDPHALTFTLAPIGDALPRFALSRNGKGLLVDASIKIKTRLKAQASASLSIGPNGVSGELSASATVFNQASPFGWFDLTQRQFVPFSGPRTGLDRFVQLADGKTVIALEKRTDGLGGAPFKIDLETKTVTPLAEPQGTSGVRDIGLLADGKTILVRVRMPAASVSGKLYSQEASYLSFDFSAQIDGSFTLFTEKVPFANADPEGCPTGYHDCW